MNVIEMKDLIPEEGGFIYVATVSGKCNQNDSFP